MKFARAVVVVSGVVVVLASSAGLIIQAAQNARLISEEAGRGLGGIAIALELLGIAGFVLCIEPSSRGR